MRLQLSARLRWCWLIDSKLHGTATHLLLYIRSVACARGSSRTPEILIAIDLIPRWPYVSYHQRRMHSLFDIIITDLTWSGVLSKEEEGSHHWPALTWHKIGVSHWDVPEVSVSWSKRLIVHYIFCRLSYDAVGQRRIALRWFRCSRGCDIYLWVVAQNSQTLLHGIGRLPLVQCSQQQSKQLTPPTSLFADKA